MASDQHTPPVDDNLGPHALAICTPILVIALLLYVIRIIPRTTPKIKLNFADYLVSAAVLCEIVTYGFFIAMMQFGFGRQTYYLTVKEIQKISLCIFPIALVGQLASALVRISIPAMLLQFGTSRLWRVSLWAAIAIQTVVVLGVEILLLCSCRPIRAIWERVPNAQCLPPRVLWTTGYIYTGTALLSDCVCAIAPLFVVIKLSRSPVERALMCFLMALGVLTTVATALRIKYMHEFQVSSSSGTSFRDTFPLYFLTRIEELILLVAASAPFLKSAIERFLERWNLPIFQNPIRDLESRHTIPETEPQPQRTWLKFKLSTSHRTGSSAKVSAGGDGSEMGLSSATSTSSKEHIALGDKLNGKPLEKHAGGGLC